MEVHVACIAEKKNPTYPLTYVMHFSAMLVPLYSHEAQKKACFFYLIENVICNINIEA